MVVDELLYALDIARVGLGPKSSLIASQRYFLFDQDSVMAFDGLIAVRVPLSEEVPKAMQAVPGHSLYDYLKAVRGKEVDFDAKKEVLTIKTSDGGKLKLPMMSAETFGYDMPDIEYDVLMEQDFFDALDALSVSMMKNPEKKISRGVAIRANEAGTRMWTTDDGNTIAMSHMDGVVDAGLNDRMIWSEGCKKLIKILGMLEDDEVYIHVPDEDWLSFCCGGVEVVVKTEHDPEVVGKMEKAIDVYSGNLMHSFDLPKDFKSRIDRAASVIPSETLLSTWELTSGKLDITAKTDFGSTYETIEFDGEAEDRAYGVAMNWVTRMFKHFEPQSVAFGERVITFSSERFDYMVGVVTTTQEE